MSLRVSFAVALLLGGTLLVHAAESGHPEAEAGRPESAQDLVREVMYNELHDRECDSYWRYRSVRQTGKQDIVREQIETSEGPIYRVLEDHGSPLDLNEREREAHRIEKLIQDRNAMKKIEQEHLQDEERLKRVMEIFPDAFLFHIGDLGQGDVVRIEFSPNPSFKPESYEARVVHAMDGTLVVNRRLKRMIEMDGRILQRVSFGYGILGYVEKGGTYEIRRVQVSDSHWKTSLVEVHVQGKVLLFQNVDKEQRELRSDFYPVPHDISLEEAKHLLDQAATEDRPSARTNLQASTRY